MFLGLLYIVLPFHGELKFLNKDYHWHMSRCDAVCSKARYEVAAAVEDIYGVSDGGKYCGPLAVTSNSLSASYSSVFTGYHDVMPVYDQRHVINNNNINGTTLGRFLKFFQCRNQKEMTHNANEKFPTVA